MTLLHAPALDVHALDTRPLHAVEGECTRCLLPVRRRGPDGVWEAPAFVDTLARDRYTCRVPGALPGAVQPYHDARAVAARPHGALPVAAPGGCLCAAMGMRSCRWCRP